MEATKQIRLLRADEIEVRVGTVRRNGVSLLLYKDARVDQNILDETFGIFGWKRSHEVLNGSMFCTVSIRGEDGEWIEKEDVGTESYSEPVKGAASDSFKRACFNIGIGRELYTAPFIWIPAEKVNIQNQDGKFYVKDSFHVSSIAYHEELHLIIELTIKNQKGEMVYHIRAEDMQAERGGQTGKNERKAGTTGRKTRKLTKAQMAALQKEMERTGVSEFHILQRYSVTSLEELTGELYQRAMEALRKTNSAAA